VEDLRAIAMSYAATVRKRAATERKITKETDRDPQDAEFRVHAPSEEKV
jgi:hypothetical protein